MSKDTKITPKEFRERYEQLKPVLYGNGKEVAKRAGISYTRFLNAIAGRINNEKSLQKIFSAMQDVAREQAQKIML